MGYYQYFRVKNTPFFGQFFEWAKIRGFGLWDFFNVFSVRFFTARNDLQSVCPVIERGWRRKHEFLCFSQFFIFFHYFMGIESDEGTRLFEFFFIGNIFVEQFK